MERTRTVTQHKLTRDGTVKTYSYTVTLPPKKKVGRRELPNKQALKRLINTLTEEESINVIAYINSFRSAASSI